jgi:hypothetical protein
MNLQQSHQNYWPSTLIVDSFHMDTLIPYKDKHLDDIDDLCIKEAWI